MARLAVRTGAHPCSNLIADLDTAGATAGFAESQLQLLTLASAHSELVELAVIRSSQALLHLNHLALDRGLVSSGRDGQSRGQEGQEGRCRALESMSHVESPVGSIRIGIRDVQLACHLEDVAQAIR